MYSCLVYVINKSDNSGFILIFATIIGAIVGAIFGFAGTWYLEKKRRENERQKEQKRRENERQKEQKRAYSRLKGCEYLILTTYKLYSVVRIDQLYWKYINLIHTPASAEDKMLHLANSPLVGRADEARYRLNESALEVGKSREKFEKYLADTELLFSDSPRLNNLKQKVEVKIKLLYDFWVGIENDYAIAKDQESIIEEKENKMNYLKNDYLDRCKKKLSQIAAAHPAASCGACFAPPP